MEFEDWPSLSGHLSRAVNRRGGGGGGGGGEGGTRPASGSPEIFTSNFSDGRLCEWQMRETCFLHWCFVQ